jgi:Spy/CpxP family protein refolding chaperone
MTRRIIMVMVIILLLVNTVVLSLLWWNKRPGNQPRNGGNAKEFIRKELALDAQQLQQFEKMRNDHFEKMQDINDKTRQLKEQLYIQVSATDTAALNNLLQQIGNNEMERDRITVEHFRQLRNILNNDQQHKFDNIIKDVMRMVGRPQPRMGGNRHAPSGDPSRRLPPGDDLPPPGSEEPPQ